MPNSDESVLPIRAALLHFSPMTLADSLPLIPSSEAKRAHYIANSLICAFFVTLPAFAAYLMFMFTQAFN